MTKRDEARQASVADPARPHLSFCAINHRECARRRRDSTVMPHAFYRRRGRVGDAGGSANLAATVTPRHTHAAMPASMRPQTIELTERATAGDAQAALALLELSMARGHRRIALLRYLQAQHLSAPLQPHHHDYVQRIAQRLSADTLAGLAAEARRRRGA
ncbi:hypothetical protein [Paraburkholderia bannensis]|uniref:hypothetical protein n=1 Tax=Paraburkholderia bannensis TaxID=765414 RepID=UPI0038CD805E